MKKNILITVLLTAVLLLTACGSTTSNPDPNALPNTQGTGTAQDLPLSTKLALGTLKLEGTELAVASDQASDLLPLWQVLSSLTSSDSAATEEINAVVNQIQETMTPEQLTAIDAMGLTNEDLFTNMEELGLAIQQVNESGTPQPRGNFQGGGPGGAPGSGGGPGGGGDAGQLTPDQIATAQARRAENGGGNRFLGLLTGAVIELLESK